jgi:hypothetical protein
MARRLISGILLLGMLSLVAFSQEVPMFVQPREAGYSSEQLATLDREIDHLQVMLRDSSLGSKKTIGKGGWMLSEFAAYTAGSLERLGYQVAIVSRQLQDGIDKVWVAVRIDLGGIAVWIPVEPLPNVDSHQTDLGDVPLVAPLIYDSDYLSYSTVVQLPENVAPIAVFRAPIDDIVETEQNAWFGHTSMDPDGEIVLYQWAFGNDVQRPSHMISTWQTFGVGGQDYVVSLTVTDSRGAQATVSTTVYVLTLQEKADKKCGCG